MDVLKVVHEELSSLDATIILHSPKG